MQLLFKDFLKNVITEVIYLCLGYSLSHGLNIFQRGKSCNRDTMKLEAQAEKSKVGGLF